MPCCPPLSRLRQHLFACHLDTPRRLRRDQALLDELRQRLAGGETVLDLGAGSGFLTLRLAGMLPEGRVMGVDSSAAMLAVLQRRVGDRGLAERVQAVQADAADTGLPAASVDVVVSTALLHELHEPDAALAEVVRVLRPGGWVLFKDFRMSPVRGRLSKWIHPAGCHGPFTPAVLGTAMRAAGLTEVKVVLDGPRMLLARGCKP